MKRTSRLTTAAGALALLIGVSIAAAAPAQAAQQHVEDIGYTKTSGQCYQQVWSRERAIRNGGGSITRTINACNTHHRATIIWFG